MLCNEQYVYVIQAGARLVINSPDKFPLVDEDGMDVSPTTYTQVAISEVSLGYSCLLNNNRPLIYKPQIIRYVKYSGICCCESYHYIGCNKHVKRFNLLPH